MPCNTDADEFQRAHKAHESLVVKITANTDKITVLPDKIQLVSAEAGKGAAHVTEWRRTARAVHLQKGLSAAGRQPCLYQN